MSPYSPLLVLSMLASSVTVIPPDAIPPPTDPIPVRVVANAGSGCPFDTVEAQMLADNTAFVLDYSSFLAQEGANLPLAENRKNCQVALDVSKPEGYTFAVTAVEYHGQAFLEENVVATHQANFYSAGMPMTRLVRSTIQSPLDGPWSVRHDVKADELVFEFCGTNQYISINTELRVRRSMGKSQATNFLSLMPVDGSRSVTYHLIWRSCRPI